MPDDPTRPGRTPGAPPKLDRVPAGYKPPPLRPAEPASPKPAAGSPPAPPPDAKGAPPLPAPAGPPSPKPAYVRGYQEAGLEVTPDAAIAAGIALAGNLEESSAIRLFYLAAATQAAGRLTLTDDVAARALIFRKGTVENASSTAPDDDLLRFLVRKGALRQEQLFEAEAAREAAGGDAVGALFRGQLVNPSEVAGVLQEHGTALVARALASEHGTWRWEPNVAPPPSSFPLGNPFAMLCAAARTIDVQVVRHRLGDREGRAASRMQGRIRLEDLRLTPQEARVAAAFDGRSPAEMAAASPAEAVTALRLALFLGEVELVTFGAPRTTDPGPRLTPQPMPAAASPPAAAAAVAAAPAAPGPPRPAGPRSPPAAARPPPPAAQGPSTPPAAAPPRPAAPPAAASPKPAAPPAAASPKPAAKPAPAPKLDAKSLRELAAAMKGKDHFGVLGVKRDAPPAQVKTAYFQLAKAYHPDAVPVAAGDEARKLAAEVFARVSEAWAVLGDENRTKAYLEELASGGAVDIARIFEAENTFHAGTLLVKARRYDEAVKRFDEAIALNADEAEFGMWKAWCEFLLAEDRKRAFAGASRAILDGLQRNPRCAPGYLFLGQMAKLVGDLKTAERHLRRGLEVTPDHPDLARELKYLGK